jgi:hypothetical protein
MRSILALDCSFTFMFGSLVDGVLGLEFSHVGNEMAVLVECGVLYFSFYIVLPSSSYICSL